MIPTILRHQTDTNLPTYTAMSSANCLSTLNPNTNQWLPCLVLLSVLSVFGALINGLILFIFLRIKSLVNNANKFLITLTIGQILLALVIGPFHIIQIVETSDTTDCYLDSLKPYVEAFVLVSAVSNGVVSYDRYLHISLSYNYKCKMTGTFLYVLLLCPWASVFVYVICLAINTAISYLLLIFLVISLGFILPYNYVRLIKKLSERLNNVKIGMQMRIVRRKRNNRAAYLCVSIIIVEFLCSSVGFFTLVASFGSLVVGSEWTFWSERVVMLREVSLISFMASACINPFFYLCNHRQFKHYASIFFNAAKVGPARVDFVEERKARGKTEEEEEQEEKEEEEEEEDDNDDREVRSSLPESMTRVVVVKNPNGHRKEMSQNSDLKNHHIC